MQATVIGMSQDYSFETGEVKNHVLIRLEGGEVVRALVGDDEALRITEAFVRKNGALAEMAPSDVHAGRDEFDSDPERRAPEDRAWSPARVCEGEDECVEEPAQPAPRAQQSAAALSVDKDDYGNPVFLGAGLVDPATLLGGDGAGEEDGVGSI
jgi:hypothetical protein